MVRSDAENILTVRYHWLCLFKSHLGYMIVNASICRRRCGEKGQVRMHLKDLVGCVLEVEHDQILARLRSQQIVW